MKKKVLSNMDKGEFIVINNLQKQRYEIKLGQEYAFSTYTMHDGKVVFLHTEVPEAWENQGVATKLIGAALDDVAGKGLKAVAWCPYVAAFVEKHPAYQYLMVHEKS